MKTTIIFLLVFFSFLLTSCADPEIGKPVDHYLPFSLSSSGHETIFFSNTYVLDYSYNVNKNDKSIIFTGTINCKRGAHNWNSSEGRISIKFVSKEGKILKKHTLKSWWDEELCTEKSFQSTYPFQHDYDGVTFSCKINMWE